MGFFNRNKPTAGDHVADQHAHVHAPAAAPAATADTNTTATPKSHVKGSGKSKFGRHADPYTMSTRPKFGQWLKCTWLDIVTMAIMGAIGLGVRLAFLLFTYT